MMDWTISARAYGEIEARRDQLLDNRPNWTPEFAPIGERLLEQLQGLLVVIGLGLAQHQPETWKDQRTWRN